MQWILLSQRLKYWLKHLTLCIFSHLGNDFYCILFLLWSLNSFAFPIVAKIMNWLEKVVNPLSRSWHWTLITEKSSQNKSNMSWQRVELPFLWSPAVWWDCPEHSKGMEETVIWYFLILGKLLGWSLYSNDSLDLLTEGFDMEKRRKKIHLELCWPSLRAARKGCRGAPAQLWWGWSLQGQEGNHQPGWN